MGRRNTGIPTRWIEGRQAHLPGLVEGNTGTPTRVGRGNTGTPTWVGRGNTGRHIFTFPPPVFTIKRTPSVNSPVREFDTTLAPIGPEN